MIPRSSQLIQISSEEVLDAIKNTTTGKALSYNNIPDYLCEKKFIKQTYYKNKVYF